MKIDFNKSIFENAKERKTPFLAAHRGVNGANVPCNTLLSYKTALDQGADVVEIDVTKSKDGEFFVFHPYMEPVFLEGGKYIHDMTAEEVKKCRLLNADRAPTHYTVPTLKEVLLLLKDKAYINVDKFWTDIKGISEVIRACGVEKQVIVKTDLNENCFAEIEKYAPDFMYMPMVWHNDTATETLLTRNLNYVGIEALFDTLNDQVCQKDYIKSMHEKGLLVWANAIVYNEEAVISAHLTDDISLEKGGDAGWGKLTDLGFDFIQTDWLSAAKCYLLQK